MILRAVVGAIAAATLVGLVVLWPSGQVPDLSEATAGIDYVDAIVTGVQVVSCTDPSEGLPTECQSVGVRLTSGPDGGSPASFLSSLVDFRAPRFATGDKVVLASNLLAPPEFATATSSCSARCRCSCSAAPSSWWSWRSAAGRGCGRWLGWP